MKRKRISIKCNECKKKMEMFGVTEDGSYKYQCSTCYIIVCVNKENRIQEILNTRGVNIPKPIE